MEKVNNILKPLIGFILLLSFVFTFSSCEYNDRGEHTDTDTLTVPDADSEREKQRDTARSESWKDKMNSESKELDTRLDSLKVKAKKTGGKVEQEVNQAIDKINKERKELFADSTDEKMESKWEDFKTKVKRSVDSLDKKI